VGGKIILKVLIIPPPSVNIFQHAKNILKKERNHQHKKGVKIENSQPFKVKCSTKVYSFFPILLIFLFFLEDFVK
jgi:hypothetical protein